MTTLPRSPRPTGPASAPAPARRTGRLSPRASFALRRTGRLVTSLLIVVLASFFVVHLVPGDPVRAALGPTAPVTLVENTRADLGLDRPVREQFTGYVSGLVRGDLGPSIQTRQDVAEVIASRFPTTLTLAALGFAVALAGALPQGMAAALVARSPRGRAANTVV
ncbi:hypothetical protein ACJOT0_30000, partial [Nocardiopsis sp. frass2]